ncbi:MAG: thioredoxin family protein [bacterium]|nr:thioredoxin family protein [bacterium]
MGNQSRARCDCQRSAQRRFVAASCLLPLASCLAPGCSDVIWRSDLSGAQRQAARDGRLVLVYYGSPTHEECARMDRTVFNDREVIDTMAGTIPVRLSPLLSRRWAGELGIQTVPTFVAYAPDRRVINVRPGAMDSDQFRAFVIGAKLNR